MTHRPERRPLPEWVPPSVARRLGRGRLLRRTMDEDLRLSDSFGWERQRRRRAVDLRYLVALILFIVGPPLILALIGASWPAAVAVAVGIVVNLAGAYVGYRAMSQRVEIDRG